MMRANFPGRNRGAAFTLIELMVVLVIIAIMSAVVVGEMSGSFQDVLLRSSSRQLISVFNLASSRAISGNRLHRVRFDRGTGRYVLEKHMRGDDFEPARDVPGSEGELDSRIAIRVRESGEIETPEAGMETERQEGALDNTVNFYPDGTSDGREIELRDRDGFGLALRVSSITARVQIVELERQ
jgi:prepilin-type N-terminal cleavage/methylation domain-containing protein